MTTSKRPTRPLAAAAAFAVLLGAAVPAHAQPLDVTGITVTLPGPVQAVLSVPSVSVVDGTLDEATIRSLFSAGPAGVAADLAALDARLISIPVLTVSDHQLAYPLVVLHHIVLEDVAAGRAAHAEIGSIAVSIDATSSVDLGKVSVDGLNIKTLMGLSGLVEAADRTTQQPVYDGLDVAGFSLASPEADCTIAALRLGAFTARPLAPETVATLQQMSGRKGSTKLTPAETVALVNMYVDLLSSYRSGASSLDSMSCDAKTGDGPGKVTIGSITQGEAPFGIVPSITYAELGFERPDGKVTIGDFTLKEIDFNGQLEAVKEQGAGITPEWVAANFRKLIPAAAGFSMTDIAADIPDGNAPDKRNQMTLGSFDLTLSDYVNGIPADISSAVEGLHVALAETDDNAQLIAMGYATLDIGAGLALHWDREAATIVLDDVSVDWSNGASLKVSGVIGNATPDLFSDSPATAMKAAQAMTVKSLRVDLLDEGLLAKGVAMAAAEQGVEPAAFRQALAAMAQGTVIIGLGGAPESIGISQALMDFVNGSAPFITITATAVDPAGIGLAQLMATQADPKALLPLMKLTASTEAPPPAPDAGPTPPPAPDSTPAPDAASTPPPAPDAAPPPPPATDAASPPPPPPANAQTPDGDKNPAPASAQ